MLSGKTERLVSSVVNIVKAEYLKTSRSMRRRFIWMFPVITLALGFVLTAGMKDAYAESVWNWWYGLLLPGMIAIICYLSGTQEKKTGYYNFMTLSVSKRQLMYGKIIYMGCVILISNVIICVGALSGGLLLTTSVPAGGAVAAVFILAIVQLWEIPVFLFLSERFGMITELLICLFLSVFGTLISQTGKWYFLVSAIPMRILSPVLRVLPNGLRAEDGNPMLDAGVIGPGICLSAAWFVFFTFLYLKWFEKREVK